MIQLDAVSFRYPAAADDALRDVSLSIGPGEPTLLTGRVGSGCSSALLVMAGLVPHVTGGALSGAVSTLGVDPGSEDGRREIAGRVALLLPTPWSQLSGMAYTVYDEVAFGPANLGRDRGAIDVAVTAAMAAVGVDHLAARDPRTLSGGELQRVMWAGVLAMDPDVILLDEPVAELDGEAARTLLALLSGLAQRKTVVMASTDVDRLGEVAGRVVLFERGSVLADGPADAVLGTERAVHIDAAPTIACIARLAGLEPPYPVTVDQAARRFGS